MFPFLQDVLMGRKFKFSVLRKNCDRKRDALQCSSLDTLRHLLERAEDAIPTGWILVSDKYSQLVLVKLTMKGWKKQVLKSCNSFN